MFKNIAYLFGFVFLIVGFLGFVPSVTENGMLLGVFHVNTLHNVVHLVTGAAALVAASGCCCNCEHVRKWTPKLFFQVFGVVYAVVAVLGFWYGAAPILGVIANNFADSVLHAVTAVVALYLGFFYKE